MRLKLLFMNLKNSPKIFENYKCDYPENTVKRIEQGFEKIGLKLVYKETEIQQGTFSTYSGRAFISDTHFFTNGKGLTSELSRAGAFGEMAERFSAGLMFAGYPISGSDHETLFFEKFSEPNLPTRFYNFTHLKGYINSSNAKLGEYVSAEDFFIGKVNFSQNELNELNQSDLLLHWVDAYSLAEEKYKKIPLKLVRKFSGTNGLASGNTIEEAITQAINEIFERYSAVKIIKNKMRVPTIDINSIKDKTVLSYINFLKSQNIDVIIKDFSLGNTLPCIGVLFINNNLKNEANQLKKDLYFKKIHVGAHLNRVQALLRCFTEELQGLNIEELIFRNSKNVPWNSWVLEMKKRYITLSGEYLFLLREYLTGEDLSFLEDSSKTISFNKLFSFKSKDCLGEVKKLINICNARNWEILVIDHTHPIIQFPTVRVIIPQISGSLVDIIDGFNLKTITDYSAWEEIIYSLKNISYYIRNNDWLKSKDRIEGLINDIENYLSGHLFYPTLFINYRPLFLLDLLAFANLSVGNYKESQNYFEILTKRKFSGSHNQVEYVKIIQFLQENIQESFVGDSKNRLIKFLNLLINYVNRRKVKKFFKNFQGCSKFFNLSFGINPFSDLCNNCDKNCGLAFYKKLESMMKSFLIV